LYRIKSYNKSVFGLLNLSRKKLSPELLAWLAADGFDTEEKIEFMSKLEKAGDDACNSVLLCNIVAVN
jgi:hypothetical protein